MPTKTIAVIAIKTLATSVFPLTAAAKQLAPVDDDRTIQTPQEHHQEQVPRYVTGQHEIDRQKDGQRWPNLDFVRYGDRLTLFLFHLFFLLLFRLINDQVAFLNLNAQARQPTS